MKNDMYSTLKPLPLLLTLPMIVEHIGIPRQTLNKWLANGNTDFPAQKIGHVWRVNKLKLIVWLEKDHGDMRVTI